MTSVASMRGYARSSIGWTDMLLIVLFWYFVFSIASIGLLALIALYDFFVYRNWHCEEDDNGNINIAKRNDDG